MKNAVRNEWLYRVNAIRNMCFDLTDAQAIEELDDMELIAEAMRSELERALVAIRLARMLEKP